MDFGTILELVLAALAGAVVYGLIVRALPGKQPGEDLVDQVLARFDKTAAAMNDAATRQTAAANVLGRAAAAIQATTAPQPAPVVSPTPEPMIAAPAPVPEPAAAPATAPTWQEPPAPWPIDAKFLNPAQIAALSPDAQRRANLWQQAIMSASVTGNAQNPVPAAMMIYRAGLTPSAELGNPLTPVWQQIFAAYGVPPPSPVQPWNYAVPTGYRPGEAAYDVRAQGYSAENPYVTQPDKT